MHRTGPLKFTTEAYYSRYNLEEAMRGWLESTNFGCPRLGGGPTFDLQLTSLPLQSNKKYDISSCDCCMAHRNAYIQEIINP